MPWTEFTPVTTAWTEATPADLSWGEAPESYVLAGYVLPGYISEHFSTVWTEFVP